MSNKQYKPGQLVTIEGKVYRIKERIGDSLHRYNTCKECEIMNGELNICRRPGSLLIPTMHLSATYRFCANLPYGYYLRKVNV